MAKIYTEINTSYIPDEDITIIWQDMYKCIDGEGDSQIQRALIGWYHGRPHENTTAFYSSSNPLLANYVDCEN